MLYFPILLLFLFTTVLGQKYDYCQYDQGQIDVCAHGANKLSLRLPIHARTALLVRVKNSETFEQFPMDETVLDQLRVAPDSDSDQQPGCKVEPQDKDFTQFIDVSSRLRGSPDGAWYVACIDYAVVADPVEEPGVDSASQDGQIPFRRSRAFKKVDPSPSNATDSTCTRCTLIRPTGGSRFLKSSWVNERDAPVGRNGAKVLRYISGDMPFVSATLQGRIIDVVDREEVHQFTNLIKPRQQAFIPLPRLPEYGRYIVTTDVLPLDKNGTRLLVNGVPLVLHDVVSQEITDDYPYIGEKNGSGNGAKKAARHWLDWFVTPGGPPLYQG